MDARFFSEYINYGVQFSIESTGVPQLTAPQVSRHTIPVPPKVEQRAIADLLSGVDRLLDSLEGLIDKKRSIKEAAMQQLLSGRCRLPGFSEQWRIRRLGAFAGCTAGGTPSTHNPDYWGGSIRWMNSGELNHKVIHDVKGRITAMGLRKSSAQLLPPRCVLIGLAGQGKTRGTVARNTVTLSTNQSIAAVLPNASFVPEYLYFNLDSRYDELRGMSTGVGGRGGLNLTIIRSILVPCPPVEEQAEIANVLLNLEAEIEALEQRRDKSRAVKQGMMQQLLTGRTRLVEQRATCETTAS